MDVTLRAGGAKVAGRTSWAQPGDYVTTCDYAVFKPLRCGLDWAPRGSDGLRHSCYCRVEKKGTPWVQGLPFFPDTSAAVQPLSIGKGVASDGRRLWTEYFKSCHRVSRPMVRWQPAASS